MRNNPDSPRTQLANAETASDEIARLRGERDRVIATLLDTREVLAQTRRKLSLAIEAANQRVFAAEQRVLAVESSVFWRASRPLRRLSGKLPAAVRANIARAMRLALWTVSQRLRTRLRERAMQTQVKTMVSPSEPAGPLPASLQPPIPLHET